METTKSITLAKLVQLLNAKQNITVVDVRSEQEYNEKHIPFAINVPIELIEAKKHDLDLEKIIITVCGKGGGRSEKAANILHENSIGQVFFLEDGTFGWFENENNIKLVV